MNPIDASITLFLNQFVGRSWLADRFMYFLSNEHLVKGGVSLALFWSLWFLPGDRREENRRRLVLLLGSCLVALTISRLFQVALPFRHRPIYTPELGLTISSALPPHVLEGWSSFPSDHAALFFALATGIYLLSPILGWLAAAHAIVIVSLPRLYLGMHFATDLMAGAAIGIATTYLICGGHDRTGFGLMAVRWEQHAPAIFYPALFLITFEFARLFEDVRNIGTLAVKTAQILLQYAEVGALNSVY
jgi:undecaprenyl-diphosphatase